MAVGTAVQGTAGLVTVAARAAHLLKMFLFLVCSAVSYVICFGYDGLGLSKASFAKESLANVTLNIIINMFWPLRHMVWLHGECFPLLLYSFLALNSIVLILLA